MARASTTSDAFNAVAEPRRREILSYLAGAERPVGEIVAALGLEQPSVSKHLRVLRDVGLVRMRCQGRQKLYRTNAEAIRPLHEWAGTFERYWQHQLNRVKELAEEARISIRNVRRDANKHADQGQKDKNLTEDECDQTKEQVQELTKKFEGKVNDMAAAKEKEVMND